jgi:DNA-binding PadR family transcriptional regulator
MFGHAHHHPRHGRRHGLAYAAMGREDFGGEGGFGRDGFGRGGWGGGRGGPRGGRPLDQGDLRHILLDLIAQKPRHGYELIKAIEEAMEGHYSPSPGVVYPTLTLLEETGLISAEVQGVKKLYSLTDEGRAHLEQERAAIDAAKARMEEARRRFGPRPSAEIGRAMHNLGAALSMRLRRGPLSQQELRAVVDAIDAAARGVERA